MTTVAKTPPITCDSCTSLGRAKSYSIGKRRSRLISWDLLREKSLFISHCYSLTLKELLAYPEPPGPLAYLPDFPALDHSVWQLPALRWAQSHDTSAAFSINKLTFYVPLWDKRYWHHKTLFFPAQGFWSSVSVSHFIEHKTIPSTRMMEVPLLKSCWLISGHALYKYLSNVIVTFGEMILEQTLLRALRFLSCLLYKYMISK